MQKATPKTHLLASSLIESGNVAETSGSLDAAHEKYAEATRIAPDYARAWLNLGIVLAAKTKLNEAIGAYDRAIELEPDSASAYYNRGLALTDFGAAQLAEVSFLAAIKYRPIFPDAYVALALALESQDRNDEAIRALAEALQQAPAHPGYLLNLALLQRKMGMLDQAEEVLRRACTTDVAHGAAAHALASVLRDKGSLRDACHALDTITQDDPAYIEACSGLLFTLLFRDDILPQAVYAKHEEVGAIIERSYPVRFKTHDNVRATTRRLRVGYVSGDFGRHAVAFFALPVIEGHDRESFEVYCYSNAETSDDVTESFRTASDVWRDLRGMDHATATKLLREDEIDILVDLSGHTGGNHLDLFARKPSPIQVSWLGYLCTTGLGTIDYRLCDRNTDPPGASERLHTEILAALPHSLWCYRPYLSPEHATVPPIAKNGFATFGSFNQFPKLSPTIRRLWAKILNEVPHSRFLVVGVPDGQARDAFLDSFEREGVNPNRIDAVPRVSMSDYYELFNDVDVVLDTTPYCGATTTCDALWMSVPVVTLAGGHSVARSGVSLLTTVGLPDLIARSPEDYVRLAIALARDTPRLTAFRRGFREQMRQSPLMNEPKFVLNIETLYRQMWMQWCQGTAN